MSAAPSLDELRNRVQKGRHREVGNWLARYIARPTAVYGCWLAVRLGLSANQVTLAALVSSVASAIAIGSGDRLGFITGVLLAHLAFWLDHVDGQVARWNGSASLDGVYFDYLMHHVANLCLGFALGFGLALRTTDPSWTIAGFAIALGWTSLNLHNDCRYKAFFQRLKSTSDGYIVRGGAGGRPAPPTPWPRHGSGAVTWPAYKFCEPHTVLATLTIFALIAAIQPPTWLLAWTSYVRFMALLAPLLATARIARSLTRHSVEQEFAIWFEQTTETD
jgi:hypothetical protein